ncbi:MAG: helix-turn-helix transcriptional regulator [Gammaproteobacteria bacterium]|nr:helix-turn-helix transcriptional regulator [Gammaproteobacteria bacterium]
MLAIPLPFVVSLLLTVLAGNLWAQRAGEARMACYFLLMCALTTAVVGLRWSTDLAIFRFLQPILASLIPVVAWYVFASAAGRSGLSWLHWVTPGFVALCSLMYPLWPAPLDLILTGLYIGYGVALIRTSWQRDSLPVNVRISALGGAVQAERLAGGMLIFSALIDGVMTIDFAFFEGRHATIILSVGHALLLPVLSFAVVFISLVTTTGEEEQEPAEHLTEDARRQDVSSAGPATGVKDSDRTDKLAAVDVAAVTGNVEVLLQEQRLYLDPDLTLAKIARKAGIPARQVSYAINQRYGRNISQVVNEFRIAHARELLENTDAPITQVYLNAGFQTKSNFHREFSRVTSMSPSMYRRDARQRQQTAKG